VSIGSIMRRVVPTAIGFATGGPLGAATAAVGTERQLKQKKVMERQEFMYQQDPGLSQGFSGVQPSTASAGSGSL